MECRFCDGQGGHLGKEAPDSEKEYFECEMCSGTGEIEPIPT